MFKSEFLNKTVKYLEMKVLPKPFELPNSFSLPQEFWNRVISMYRFTDKDDMERACSLFYVDKDFVFSPITTGNREEVTLNNPINVSYEPLSTYHYEKRVTINNTIVDKRRIYKTELPKSIMIYSALSLHTHPYSSITRSEKHYETYSITDLNSLKNGAEIGAILVTNIVGVIFKTRSGFTYYKANFNKPFQIDREKKF